MKNRKYISDHKSSSYFLKMNQFGDMTIDEIIEKYLYDYERHNLCDKSDKNCHVCTEDDCYNHHNVNNKNITNANNYNDDNHDLNCQQGW